MPRPKSDLSRHQLMLDPATLDNLSAVAAHHGWLSERGEPSRSLAVRRLAEIEASRVAKKQRGPEENPE